MFDTIEQCPRRTTLNGPPIRNTTSCKLAMMPLSVSSRLEGCDTQTLVKQNGLKGFFKGIKVHLGALPSVYLYMVFYTFILSLWRDIFSLVDTVLCHEFQVLKILPGDHAKVHCYMDILYAQVFFIHAFMVRNKIARQFSEVWPIPRFTSDFASGSSFYFYFIFFWGC